MPLLTLRIAAAPDRTLATHAAAALHQLTVTHLGKRPELIAVAVDFVDPATWFIAGEPLAGTGLASYHLAITITDETNTKAEKARFMAATHAALSAKGYECMPVKEFKRGDELLARFFFIQDPDGYKIEMLERHGHYQ